jgi:hypothetical protein
VGSVSGGGTADDALLEGLNASLSLLPGEGLRRCADVVGGLKVSCVLDVRDSLRDWRLGLEGTGEVAVARVSALMRGDESVR